MLKNILPPNKPKKVVETPKNFFIYGQTMNGKSYLACEFPNPLFLDTDGNAEANPYPAIELRNIKDGNGKISRSVIQQLDEIITALQVEKHSYETVVLDVIDDIVTMMETAICDENGVQSLGDIPYGKGYSIFKSVFQQMVVELKALPMNVVYVSRIMTKEENNIKYELPSLPEKYVNVVNGNCDFLIQAKKVGKNYLRITKDKRKNYTRDLIQDERILKILDTVTGAFDKSQSISKVKQDKIVKALEKETEAILNDEVTEDVVDNKTEDKVVNDIPKLSPEDESFLNGEEDGIKELESTLKVAKQQREAKAKGGAVATRPRPVIKKLNK